MEYYCKICNYKAPKKYNYKRHLLSAKHVKNLDIKRTASKNDAFASIIDASTIVICEYCNCIISHRNNKQRHYRNCKKKFQYRLVVVL